MNRIKQFHLTYTSATLVSILGAAIAVAVSFGAQLSQAQTHSILTLAGILAAAITIGGGAKTAGMITAGLVTTPRFHFTAATITAIGGALVSVLVSFGLHVSPANEGSILTLVALLAGGMSVGGGLKSAAMLRAGIHPQSGRRAWSPFAGVIQFPWATAETTADGEPLTAADLNASVLGRAAEDTPQGGLVTVSLETHRRGRGEDVHPVLRAHGTFEGLRLGKQEPKVDARTPVLGEFLAAATILPKLPTATHRLDPIVAALGGDFGMMGNDTYGDCTCAALGHAVQEWTGSHGQPVTLTAAQILDLYWKTGTPPSPGADDNGRVMFAVLKYAHANGIAGHELGAYVSVGLRRFKHRDVKAAIDLFGGCYLGVALPETAQSQSTWDVAGDPSKPGPAQAGSWGGHAIWGADYDKVGVTVITWGHPLKMTWRFLDAYADEGYALIGPDWLSGGKTIDGFDVAALTKYLSQIKQGYQPPM